jgi:hypothetical protein
MPTPAILREICKRSLDTRQRFARVQPANFPHDALEQIVGPDAPAASPSGLAAVPTACELKRLSPRLDKKVAGHAGHGRLRETKELPNVPR